MDAARAVAIPLSVTEPAQRAALVVASTTRPSSWSASASSTSCATGSGRGWSTRAGTCPEPQGNFVWLQIGAAGAGRRRRAAASTGSSPAPSARVRVSVGEEESVDKLLTAAAEVVGMRPTDRLNRPLDWSNAQPCRDRPAALPGRDARRRRRCRGVRPLIDETRRRDAAGLLPRHGRHPRRSTSRPRTCSARASSPSGCRASARRPRRSDRRSRPARRTTSSPRTASTRSRCIRGVDPVDIIRLLRGLTHGGWDPAEPRQLPPLHARDRVAGAARHRLRDGRAVRRRQRHGRPGDRRGRHRLLRRRGDEPGRCQRGDRLRRQLPDAPGVLPAEQPLGDLGAGRAPVAHAAGAPRRRVRHPERAGRRQRRARRYAVTRKIARRGALPAAARSSSRR